MIKHGLAGLAIIAALCMGISTSISSGEVELSPREQFLKRGLVGIEPPCLQMFYYIEIYADSFNIPKAYAYGIANAETSYGGPFDWKYKHKRTSKAGAVGPMQIMPTTAAYIHGVDRVSIKKLRSDIGYNVKTSMKLLKKLHDRYGDWKVAFGCYNTGRPCVNEYAMNVYNYKPTW